MVGVTREQFNSFTLEPIFAAAGYAMQRVAQFELYTTVQIEVEHDNIIFLRNECKIRREQKCTLKGTKSRALFNELP